MSIRKETKITVDTPLDVVSLDNKTILIKISENKGCQLCGSKEKVRNIKNMLICKECLNKICSD